MPSAHSRPIRVALYTALAALGGLLLISARDAIAGGGALVAARLLFSGLGAGALLIALRRQGEFSTWVIERQRLESDLRASEARYAGILAIAAEAIISVDTSQRIVHFNHGAEAIFGYAATEAIGEPVSGLLPPRYRESHAGLVRAFGKGSEQARRMGERRQIFGLRKSGEEFPAEASISKLALADGSDLFTVVLRDTTVRTRMEEDERFLSMTGSELARTLEYDAVVQTIANLPVPRLANACLVYLIEGDALSAVPSSTLPPRAAAALEGLARRHAGTWDSPSPVVDVLRRGSPELVEPIDAEWLETFEEHPAAVVHWRALEARAMYIVPLLVGSRTSGALVLIASDPKLTFDAERVALADRFASVASLTLENARLLRAAQRANQGRDNILGIVSHDLRNPIGAIAMCARVLRDAPPADVAERDGLLTTISQSTEWIYRLIQDLLDVSSIEQGRLSIERQQEPVAPLLDAVSRQFEVEAKSHGIALTVERPDGVPPLYADGGRIAQLLGNLIRNALTFTPDGGRITLRAVANDGQVVLSVQDTGRGIAEKAQARIFDRFWHDSQGTRARGAGLGLSIAKGIVEAHGGRIWLDSAPGRGTAFYFSLPIASPLSRPASAQPGQSSG